MLGACPSVYPNHLHVKHVNMCNKKVSSIGSHFSSKAHIKDTILSMAAIYIFIGAMELTYLVGWFLAHVCVPSLPPPSLPHAPAKIRKPTQYGIQENWGKKIKCILFHFTCLLTVRMAVYSSD